MNLFTTIADAVADPDKVLIDCPGGARLSYGAFFDMTGRLASALAALGVRPGDRVAVQVEKSWQALALYLATLRAGAVFLPLNTAYTAAEIAYFLGDAEPALFVCRPDSLAALAPVARQAGVPEIAALGQQGDGTLPARAAEAAADFTAVPRDDDDLAAILYTSGTTGRSKGAMLSHENLRSNALALVEAWRFTASDVLVHALPIYHTHGLFVATNVVLLSGGSMIFMPRFDADQLLAAMARATSLMGVPTFYTRLVDHPGLTRAAAAHMRLFVSGSAPLLAETHRRFFERTGHAILERYGMTETSMIASNPYDGDRVPGAVGFALPGVALRIADPETGRPLPDGEIGVIEVKGPNVFKGYWRMPEKTAAEFRPDGFFVTGDLGRIDERGYVHIVGRGKDLVISGGFNVYPKEVEAEIDALPGVVESAVFGVPHPDLGEGVTAAVVRESGGAIDEAGVLAAIRDRLARFKQPKRVLFVEELPRNSMGKIQKNLLRDAYRDLYAAASAQSRSS
ncbi:MAG: malonyl-CoA synthase [Alphaproteobacteria bacterium]|nr:MAG: malonyl-CoA synthase [Alphaproteobacteria bacterium]